MGKMEQAFKSEILRLTKKQFRQTVNPLSKDVKELKRVVSRLQRLLGKLDDSAGNGAKKEQTGQSAFQTTQEEVKAARISSKAIKNIRKKLGISQEKLATLLNVSPGAVAFWEQGRAKPRGGNKAALVSLRRMGRRLVKRMLAEKGI
jgi:DNA-binding transcriptional regulator YiaG